MESLGHTLIKARKEAKLSIDELAKKTRIKKSFLVALEKDDISPLPKKIFTLGFIQILAKTLHLEEKDLKDKLLHLYEDESAHQDEDFVPQSLIATNKKIHPMDIIDKIFTKRNSLISGALVLMIYLGVSLSNFINNIMEETKSRTTQIAKKNKVKKSPLKTVDQDLFEFDATKKHLTQDTKKEEEETKKKKEEPTVKEANLAKVVEVMQDKIEKSKNNEKDETKKESEELKLSAMPLNLYTIKDSAKENDDEELLPKSIRKSVDKDLENVFINAYKDDTWISYKVDDQKVKRYILKKGRTLLLKGKRILLLVGNLNASKIFLNNKLVEAKSRSGVKSLVFPEKEAAKLKLPLFVNIEGKLITSEEYLSKLDN